VEPLLTGQDIRLAYYSESQSVTTIRLAGVHSDGHAATRMLKSAKDRNILDPWGKLPEAYKLWGEWWGAETHSAGTNALRNVFMVLSYREQGAAQQFIIYP
jgi:hypothetical protein